MGPDSTKKVGDNEVHILLLYHNKYFNKSDEKYAFFQNDVLKESLLTKNLVAPFELSPQRELTKTDSTFFYELTIPIFSANHNTAFVKVTFICFKHWGRCDALFLRKLNGKWRIVSQDMLWIA